MGQVIAFKARAKTPRQEAEPITGDGQILFFRGVRYCRIDETDAYPAAQAPDRDSGQGGGRKRRKRARA